MTVKQSEVDSLHNGDVIELRDDRWPGDSIVRGPVVLGDYGFVVGPMLVTTGLESLHLTVVSKAPRPLYVNHHRAEPVPGDVACDDEVQGDPAFVWCYLGMNGLASWCDRWGYTIGRSDLPARLRLLVDGETARVVP